MTIFYFTTRDGACQGECFFSGDMAFISAGSDPAAPFMAYKLDYKNASAPEFMEGVLLFGTEIERGQYLMGTGKA